MTNAAPIFPLPGCRRLLLQSGGTPAAHRRRDRPRISNRYIHRDSRQRNKGLVGVKDGGVGLGHQVGADADTAAGDASGATGWRGVDAATEGGVPGADRLHGHEQGQRQRLVPHLGGQPRGHPLDGALLVRPQPPPVRVRCPVRHTCHLSRHSPRDRAPSTRRQDTEDVPGREDLPDGAFQALMG